MTGGRAARSTWVAAAALALAGCPDGAADPGADPDPPADEPGCAEGEIEDGGACVPEACALGPWGDADAGAGAVYVDAAAASGGEGTAEAPFTSLDRALDAIAGEAEGVTLVVAAGTYFEQVYLTRQHDGLTVRGRCRDLVTVDASLDPDGSTALTLDAPGGSAAVSGITFTGAAVGGVEVQGGHLDVEASAVTSNRLYGLGVLGADQSAALRDVVVRDTTPGDLDGTGMGLLVQFGSVTAEDCLFESNSKEGIFADDAQLDLRRVTVRGTLQEGGDSGRGVLLQDGAELTARDSRFEDNALSGIEVSYGSVAWIEDVIITGSRGESFEEGGAGMLVYRSEVEATRCRFEGNQGAGVYVVEGEARLAEVELIGNRSFPDGTNGIGLRVVEGSTVALTGSVLEGNTRNGAFVDSSSDAQIADSVVRGTLAQLADVPEGFGLYAGRASVVVRDSTFESNTDVSVLVAGGSLELDGVLVQDTHPDAESSFAVGVAVLDGGVLTATDTHVTGGAGLGVQVSASVADLKGGSIRGVERTVAGTLASALAAGHEAEVTAEGLVLSDIEGVGLYTSSSSTLTCRGCDVQGAAFAGAVARSASLRLFRTDVGPVGPDAYRGGGVGIFADDLVAGPAEVLLSACDVAAQPLAGLYLVSGGAGSRFRVLASALDGGGGPPPAFWPGGNALFATGPILPAASEGGSDLVLAGNTLGDCPGGAVFLHGGASATLSGNTWQGNDPDVFQEACEPGTPPPFAVRDRPRSVDCRVTDDPANGAFRSVDLIEVHLYPEDPAVFE